MWAGGFYPDKKLGIQPTLKFISLKCKLVVFIQYCIISTPKKMLNRYLEEVDNDFRLL